jgi:hypothetical protein
VAPSGCTEYSAVGMLQSSSAQLTELPSGRNYSVAIAADNSLGLSEWSSVRCDGESAAAREEERSTWCTESWANETAEATHHLTTLGVPARPDPPTRTVGSFSGVRLDNRTALLIGWLTPFSNALEVLGFELLIVYGVDGTARSVNVTVSDGGGEQYLLSGLTPDSSVNVSVRAVNALGAGEFSEAGVFHTAAADVAQDFGTVAPGAGLGVGDAAAGGDLLVLIVIVIVTAVCLGYALVRLYRRVRTMAAKANAAAAQAKQRVHFAPPPPPPVAGSEKKGKDGKAAGTLLDIAVRRRAYAPCTQPRLLLRI